MLTIEAYAKINLTLEVLGKRADGYHELRSVIQTVSMSDTLHFSENAVLEFYSDSSPWSAEKSLVSRAVELFKKETGNNTGFRITIEKRIPMAAGLGGDSSDAAAVLVGLNKLWQANLSQNKLVEIAAQLGSDVPFFIYGGTCLMEGRGERILPLPSITDLWIVIAVPPIPQPPNKTKRMYEALKPEHYTDGKITEELLTKLRQGGVLDASCLFNTFENIAFARGYELATYREHILKIGAPQVHLAGSGPAMFTTYANRREADDLYTRLKNQGMEVFLTRTVSIQ